MAQQLQHFGRGALRVAKNYTKGYSDTQTKVREATSNDPWGPSGTQMNEIAQLTYNQGDFVEVMEMLDKRLNDKGKNWRHVFKALTLLDYCLHAGSENVVIYFKDNLYVVKTLKEFVYVDDQGKDVGHNVRQKAKDITNLLQDEDRLRAERRQRGAMRDRMLGNIADSGLRGEDDFGGRSPGREQSNTNNGTGTRRRGDEDDEIKRAIQASMDTNADDERRRNQRQQEDDELSRAIRASEDAEAKRKREQEEANQKALFDDSNNMPSNNMYAQQPLVDLSPQPIQPQFTSYNPFYAQMQLQQQQQQEEYMRQQMLLQQQQQLQQQQMLQQQQYLQQQHQQQLFAQPTGYGSNNPFAPATPQTSLFDPQPTGAPSFSPQPQQPAVSPAPAPALSPTTAPAKPAWQAPQPKDDGKHTGLAQLLGRGREDGLDTFGNSGVMRIPVGTGFADSNRMAVQQTGTNPFHQQQQQQQQQQRNDQPFFSI